MPPILKATEPGPDKKRVLTAPLEWRDIVVPEGFRTDFYSVTWAGKLVVPRDPLMQWPAVIHDYGYVIQNRSREEVDKLFLEAMIEAGVPAWRRALIYRAVRIGGGFPWRDNIELREHSPRGYAAYYGLDRPACGLRPQLDDIDV